MLDNNNISGSKTVSRAAIIMCLTRSREEEREMKQQFAQEDVRAAAGRGKLCRTVGECLSERAGERAHPLPPARGEASDIPERRKRGRRREMHAPFRSGRHGVDISRKLH